MVWYRDSPTRLTSIATVAAATAARVSKRTGVLGLVPGNRPAAPMCSGRDRAIAAIAWRGPPPRGRLGSGCKRLVATLAGRCADATTPAPTANRAGKDEAT